MPPPDRWDAYCPMGNVISGTKFIAFKVPLKEGLLHGVAEEEKFSPTILLAQLSEKGMTLAGVIDLTFTWKYYNKEDFISSSVDHKKVFTKGREVPSDAVFKKFSDAVESLSESENLIGVHCTHGVNRTGYLICRYMIEKMKMEPQEAIDLFNDARGHNLERENYLEDLKKRKSGVETLGLNGDSAEGRGDDRQSSRGRKQRWRHHREDHPDWRPPRYPSHGFPPPPYNAGRGGHRRGNYEDAYANNAHGRSYNNPSNGLGRSYDNPNNGHGMDFNNAFDQPSRGFRGNWRQRSGDDHPSGSRHHWQNQDYFQRQYQRPPRHMGLYRDDWRENDY